MPERKEILDKLKQGIDEVTVLKAVLDTLYNDETFGTTANRALLTMLIHGCDYLISNVKIIRDKYRVTGE